MDGPSSVHLGSGSNKVSLSPAQLTFTENLSVSGTVLGAGVTMLHVTGRVSVAL